MRSSQNLAIANISVASLSGFYRHSNHTNFERLILHSMNFQNDLMSLIVYMYIFKTTNFEKIPRERFGAKIVCQYFFTIYYTNSV